MGDNSPISRDEKLLRKLLGQSIQTEPPQSRIEMLLQQIIDGGGVGGSYKIKDAYATLADLQAAHPTGAAGDAYLVGNPAHVYVWAEDASAWEDGGAFSAIAGPAGNGIKSIAKTATVGLVDTYTITFDDDTTETFDVTNGEDGVGIVSIAKTATVGLVDTYTITLTDGSTYDFTVTNGSGGSGVPEGGTTGQVLAKKSNADGDIEWVDQSGGSDVSSEIASLSAASSELASQIASTSTAQSEVDSMQNATLNSLASENSMQTSEIGSLSTAESELTSEVAMIGSEVADKQDELVEGPGIDIDSTTNEIKTEMVLFTGTHDAWDTLTTAQKKTYTHAAFTDDEQTGLVDLAPTEDSNNLVTSGGVYAAEALKQNITDNSLETTSKTVPGAINEVNSKALHSEYVEYTSNTTTDTYGYLICGLLKEADLSKLTKESYIALKDSLIFKYQGIDRDFYQFASVITDKLGNMVVAYMSGTISPTDWGVYRELNVNSSGVLSVNDISSNVIGAAVNVKLYY